MKGLSRETLGSRLKRLRNAVHMEQDIVARVLEIPRSAVAAIEQGQRDLTVIEFSHLCKLYRVSPNELLNWSPRPESTEGDAK